MQYRVTTNLRIRARAGTGYRIIGGLSQGSVVEVLDNESVGHGQWKKLAAGGWAYAGDHGEFLTPVTAGVATGPSPGAATGPPPGRHILIFFGGYWERSRPGTILTRGDGHGNVRTSASAYDAVSRQFTAPHAWNSALDNTMGNPAVNAGFNLLRRELTPQDKLVVYGFSAGGFNGLRLCERMAGDPELRNLRVDLLITVDPCLQDLPGHESFSTRTPRPAVLRHVNFYQRVGETRGRSMKGAEVDREFGRLVQGSRVNHDQMPVFTRDLVRNEISAVLRG